MATLDLSSVVNMLNQLIPLLIVLAILPAIFKLFERIFGS